jgi:Lrp/AsnC family transcriptional regulator, leucine-responsive regulatory protein
MARSAELVAAPLQPSELDDIDVRLLGALQANGRATYAELAAGVGLKPPATFERVRGLESRGIIRNYGARIDAPKVGLGLVAFVSCFTTPDPGDAGYDDLIASIAKHPEVLEVHSVAGDESYILKVITRSTTHLDELLTRLKTTAGIARTRTTVVLSTPFERDGIALR